MPAADGVKYFAAPVDSASPKETKRFSDRYHLTISQDVIALPNKIQSYNRIWFKNVAVETATTIRERNVSVLSKIK